MSLRRLSQVCLLAGLLHGPACNREPRLPELPAVALEGFAPAVQAEIEKSLQRVQSDPRNARANGLLGMVLHAHQQHASAEACYERARLLEPESFEWLYYLALVQEQQGENGEAIENLRRALALRPHYTAAELRLGDLLLTAGNLAESGELYERLVREHPEMAAAQYGLGRVRAASGDVSGAIEALRKACELFREYGPAHYALAAAYRKAGDAAQAEIHAAAFARARSSAPPREDPLEEQVLALDASAQGEARRGLGLEAAGRLRESAEAHERALAIDPALTEARINLISLYARLGQPDLAEAHYHKVVALNPNLAGAHYAYGVLLFGLDRLPEAKRAFTQALEADPQHADSHTNLGYILMVEGKRADAERHFAKAIERDPGQRLAHFHLGRLLADRKEYTAAIEHFVKTLQPEDDQTPTFTYALAATYARAGQPGRALEYARSARGKAAALGQSDLVASIERDIQELERAR
jgi:tetratricopeptide (TPR) repeat protein